MSISLYGQLKEWLNEPRIVVMMGLGNAFRCDDGIGVEVAKHFMKYASGKLKVFNCEEAPEKFIDQVANLRPSHVLMIDAADLGEEPGSIRLMKSGEMKVGSSFSTHDISLSIIIELLVLDPSAEIAVLGIQPSDTRFGLGLSPPLKKSYRLVIDLLEQALDSCGIIPPVAKRG